MSYLTKKKFREVANSRGRLNVPLWTHDDAILKPVNGPATISNIADPINAQDVATQNFVDAKRYTELVDSNGIVAIDTATSGRIDISDNTLQGDNAAFKIERVTIDGTEYNGISATTFNSNRIALSSAGAVRWSAPQSGMIFNGNGNSLATQPDTYFYWDILAQSSPNIRIREATTLFGFDIDMNANDITDVGTVIATELNTDMIVGTEGTSDALILRINNDTDLRFKSDASYVYLESARVINEVYSYQPMALGCDRSGTVARMYINDTDIEMNRDVNMDNNDITNVTSVQGTSTSKIDLSSGVQIIMNEVNTIRMANSSTANIWQSYIEGTNTFAPFYLGADKNSIETARLRIMDTTIEMHNDVDMQNNAITNVDTIDMTSGTVSSTPTTGTDIANKDYVDTEINAYEPTALYNTATTSAVAIDTSTEGTIDMQNNNITNVSGMTGDNNNDINFGQSNLNNIANISSDIINGTGSNRPIIMNVGSTANNTNVRLVSDVNNFYIQSQYSGNSNFQPFALGGNYSSTEARLFIRDTEIEMKRDVNMDGNNITNLNTPSIGTDAANKNYVDTYETTALYDNTGTDTVVFETSTGVLDFKNSQIQNSRETVFNSACMFTRAPTISIKGTFRWIKLFSIEGPATNMLASCRINWMISQERNITNNYTHMIAGHTMIVTEVETTLIDPNYSYTVYSERGRLDGFGGFVEPTFAARKITGTRTYEVFVKYVRNTTDQGSNQDMVYQVIPANRARNRGTNGGVTYIHDATYATDVDVVDDPDDTSTETFLELVNINETTNIPKVERLFNRNINMDGYNIENSIIKNMGSTIMTKDETFYTPEANDNTFDNEAILNQEVTIAGSATSANLQICPIAETAGNESRLYFGAGGYHGTGPIWGAPKGAIIYETIAAPAWGRGDMHFCLSNTTELANVKTTTTIADAIMTLNHAGFMNMNGNNITNAGTITGTFNASGNLSMNANSITGTSGTGNNELSIGSIMNMNTNSITGTAGGGSNELSIGSIMNMNNNVITGVADPVAGTDAVPRDYVTGTLLPAYEPTALYNTATTSAVAIDTSTEDIIDMKTNRITNVVDPINAQDAATRNYVETWEPAALQEANAGAARMEVVTLNDPVFDNPCNTLSNGTGNSGRLALASNGTIRMVFGNSNGFYFDARGGAGSFYHNNTDAAPNLTVQATDTIFNKDINMNGNDITNAGTVTGTFDASGDLDMNANSITGTSGTGSNELNIGSIMNMNTNAITNVADPTADQDAVTRKYVHESSKNDNTLRAAIAGDIDSNLDSLNFMESPLAWVFYNLLNINVSFEQNVSSSTTFDFATADPAAISFVDVVLIEYGYRTFTDAQAVINYTNDVIAYASAVPAKKVLIVEPFNQGSTQYDRVTELNTIMFKACRANKKLIYVAQAAMVIDGDNTTEITPYDDYAASNAPASMRGRRAMANAFVDYFRDYTFSVIPRALQSNIFINDVAVLTEDQGTITATDVQSTFLRNFTARRITVSGGPGSPASRVFQWEITNAGTGIASGTMIDFEVTIDVRDISNMYYPAVEFSGGTNTRLVEFGHTTPDANNIADKNDRFFLRQTVEYDTEIAIRVSAYIGGNVDPYSGTFDIAFAGAFGA